MGKVIPFVTKEEADRVAYAVGVIEWVTEKSLKATGILQTSREKNS